MYLIAGLGNPGREYALTRHNIGFEAIDYIAKEKRITVARDEHHGLSGTFFENGEKVLLVKPMTYMNNSGECIAAFLDYYGIPIENLIVIYDDIDLDPGHIRIRKKGSAGTHNGMRSILAHLQDQNFPRIRIGIGKKPPQWDLANYVLSKFNADEIKAMQDGVKNAAKAVELTLSRDIDYAMNELNRKPARV